MQNKYLEYQFNKVKYKLPKEIFVTETTHRDGKQGGLNFDINQGIEIYKYFCKFNAQSGTIKQAEFFIYKKEEKELFQRVWKLYLKGYSIEPTIWLSYREDNKEYLKDIEVKEAGIMIPVSNYYIESQQNLSNVTQAKKIYLAKIEEFLNLKIKPRIDCLDMTRANLSFLRSFLKDILKICAKYKVKPKIRICDTVGIGLPYDFIPLPLSIPGLVKLLINSGIESKNIEFHGHNNNYLSMANALSAIFAGCGSINGTIFGIGERTGNIALEGLILHLINMGYYKNKPNFKILNELLSLYKNLNYKLNPYIPFFGENSLMIYESKLKYTLNNLNKNYKVFDKYCYLFEAYNTQDLFGRKFNESDI
ncbi:hypothetical protein GYA19_04360 [Candidatus Beckwithbacteria bacterium]|nr:hypothetical protein [Candidatus Beckwithbacteria bacterium]